jgi:hypothetical protein
MKNPEDDTAEMPDEKFEMLMEETDGKPFLGKPCERVKALKPRVFTSPTKSPPSRKPTTPACKNSESTSTKPAVSSTSGASKTTASISQVRTPTFSPRERARVRGASSSSSS